jgi:hypothetical protein
LSHPSKASTKDHVTAMFGVISLPSIWVPPCDGAGTQDATQNLVLRERSLLPPPAGDGAAVFRYPPLRVVPSRNALPKSIHGAPRKATKTSLLRDSVPGARKRHPNLPRCACADRPAAALHVVPGGEPHLLHLPPLLAWARARACLLANTARPFKNGGTTP